MSIATIDSNALIGAELVQRAAFYQLFDNLNDAIDEVAEHMNLLDDEFDVRTGRTTPATTLEHILPDNFHEGHVPSLIKAPIDEYPNCAVTVVRSVSASGSQNLDQQNAFAQTLVVEVMVKSELSESEVDRRCKRTAEAVNIALMRDPTLAGATHGFEAEPSVLWGDVFTRKERTSYGPHWFWQGARLEIPVRKNAPSPSANAGGIFADIDQS